MIPGLSPEINNYYLDNPVPFIQDFLTLKGQTVHPYEYQQTVLNFLPSMEPHLDNQLRILNVLGARQIFGKSTTASMIGSWFPVMHDYSETIIISHRQRRANKMLSLIKQYYRKKPILRSMTKMGGHTDLRWTNDMIGLTNESTISSLTEGNDADSAVGDATNLVIIDEVARFKNAESIKAAILPTIMQTNGVMILFSSSWGAMGKGQFWAEVVKDCRENGSKNLIELDAIQCLNIQYERWKFLYGKDKADFLYKKKMEFLDEQKKIMGKYLYDMQYGNSFETGLNNVFEIKDLEKCFTTLPPLYNAIEKHSYATMVDYGKSVKTGDRTVLSTYDITDIGNIECVSRDSYSKNYDEIIPLIIERVINFPGPLWCDLGGGESQVEILNKDNSLYKLGIRPIGIIFSRSLKNRTTQDFEDKGILRKTINKYECVLRLQQYINQTDKDHNIKYCRGCDRGQYEDYVEIITPTGLKSFNHAPSGHDDEIDTDIMLMALLSELSTDNGTEAYNASIVDSVSTPTGINTGSGGMLDINIFAM